MSGPTNQSKIIHMHCFYKFTAAKDGSHAHALQRPCAYASRIDRAASAVPCFVSPTSCSEFQPSQLALSAILDCNSHHDTDIIRLSAVPVLPGVVFLHLLCERTIPPGIETCRLGLPSHG